MSRSLVGSSSSSTFGSASSSRRNCSRRRSPPDRSSSRVVSLSPVKPKSSSSELALASPPVASWVCRRSSLDRVQHPLAAAAARSPPGSGGRSERLAPLDRARVRGWISPVSSRSSVVLPEPLTPTRPIRVAGPDRPAEIAQQRSRPGDGQADVLSGRRRPCRAGWWRTAAARAGPAAAARRRSARWRRRSGTSASRSGPAARGAARPAPCAAGSSAAPRSPAACRAALGPGQHVRRVAAVVGVDHRRRAPPRSGCRRRPGTTGRG